MSLPTGPNSKNASPSEIEQAKSIERAQTRAAQWKAASELLADKTRSSVEINKSIVKPEPKPVQTPFGNSKWIPWITSIGVACFGFVCLTLIPIGGPETTAPDIAGAAVTQVIRSGEITPKVAQPAQNEAPKATDLRSVEDTLEPKIVPAATSAEPSASLPPLGPSQPGAHTASKGSVAAKLIEATPKTGSAGSAGSTRKLKQEDHQRRQELAVQPDSTRVSSDLGDSGGAGSVSSSLGLSTKRVVDPATIQSNRENCAGYVGLHREKCLQCSDQSAWLGRLSCEAQTKIRYCATRDGRDGECPSPYQQPG